jgi:hypothetical protein
MHIFSRAAAAVLLFVASSAVHAFQLGDHQKVTDQAIAEFSACFPQYQAVLSFAWLMDGNRSEDTNLFEKQLFYSHFYHPHKKLKLWWREDSSGRIANLKPDLLQCRSGRNGANEIAQLGHAIHHFQDVSVPAHVVPVNHSFWDGFENYAVTGDIASGWTCQQIASAAADDLDDILRQTAEATLTAVSSARVEVAVVGTKTAMQLGGVDFWAEAKDNGFGTYGSLGNHFGETEFTEGAYTFRVADDFYREFKRGQMKLAVRATLRGLAWALH